MITGIKKITAPAKILNNNDFKAFLISSSLEAITALPKSIAPNAKIKIGITI